MEENKAKVLVANLIKDDDLSHLQQLLSTASLNQCYLTYVLPYIPAQYYRCSLLTPLERGIRHDAKIRLAQLAIALNIPQQNCVILTGSLRSQVAYFAKRQQAADIITGSDNHLLDPLTTRCMRSAVKCWHSTKGLLEKMHRQWDDYQAQHVKH